MTENTDPQEQKLNDDELSEVSGGQLILTFWECLNSLPYRDQIYDYVTRYLNTENESACYDLLIEEMRSHGDYGPANRLARELRGCKSAVG